MSKRSCFGEKGYSAVSEITRRASWASLTVVAQVLRLLLGVLHELLEQFPEHRRAHDDLCLALDAEGVEIVFGAGHAPAAPVAVARHHGGVGAGIMVMAAWSALFQRFWPRTTRQVPSSRLRH